MSPSSPFIHGTTYYHFANPPEELEANFRKMKDMGLNTVRVAEVWPGWEVLEPQPGRYDFSQLDDYVDKACRAGLLVVMGIGINNPPFWMFEELPDLRTVDVCGQIAARRIHAANHDDPRFRRHMKAFIEAQAEHYATVDGLLAWQFGNEIRYGVDLPDSEVTHLRFRQWISEQCEQDLGLLNSLWSTSYTSWNQVFPYRSRLGPPTEGLAPLALSTRRFIAWSLAELVEWGVAILRRHSALPVFHNNHSLPAEAQYSHWDISALGDVVAHDLYPTMGTAPQADTTVHLDVASSIARTLGKDLWISETGVGQYGTYTRNRPDRKQVEAGLVEMLAAGAKAMLYFRHKPPRCEQPHKFTGSQSALRPDGSEMIYAKSIRNVSELIDRLGARLFSAKPVQPQLAVLYPEDAIFLGRDAGFAQLHLDALKGTCNLFNRLGLGVQLYNNSWLAEEDLSEYRMLYVPVCYQMDSTVAAKLMQFAESGGTVVCEARCAYVDANGWVYTQQPGAGLTELFAAAEDLTWQAERMYISAGIASRTHRCRMRGPFQSFRTKGADVLAHNDQGEVMAVRNVYGAGQAIALGFAPSLTMIRPDESTSLDDDTARDRAAAMRLVWDLAELAGLEPAVPFDSPGNQISFRYLEQPDGTILTFCANYGPQTTIELPQGTEVLARSEDQVVDFNPVAGPLQLDTFDWALAGTRNEKANQS